MSVQTDYRFIIEQAIRAPSGHNTQPWLFTIDNNVIEVIPNYQKSLLVVDPHYRELFISLGCLVENICIAASAKGYQTQVSITQDYHIAVELQKIASVNVDPLFAQINLQQTNRSHYNGQQISHTALVKLASTPLFANVNRYFYHRRDKQFELIADLIIEGNKRQMADKPFIDELKAWMRFNKKHSENCNDGLSYATFGAPNLPVCIVKPIMACYLNAKQQNKQDSKKIASSSDFLLLTTQHNTHIEWIHLGRSLQRLLLTCTELKIAYAFMNQPVEVESLSKTIKEVLTINGFPTLLLRLGFGKPQVYSRRKPIEELILAG